METTTVLVVNATNIQLILARCSLRVAADKATRNAGVATDPLFLQAIAALPDLSHVLRLPVELRVPIVDSLVAVGVDVPMTTWERLGIGQFYRAPKQGAPIDLFVAAHPN
jgi:hypothetical protein